MLDLKHYPANHVWINDQGTVKNHPFPGAKRHYLTPDSKHYPGVTTVLEVTKTEKSKTKLADWKEGKTDFELNYGLARGKWLHSKIESYLDFSRPEPCLSEISEEFRVDYTDCEDEFSAWWISVEPILDESCNEAVLLESALWDDDLCVAGTMDALTFWDGELALCDWKTSKDYVNPNWDSIQNYFCQLAAYRKMINQVYKDDYIEVNKAVLVVAVPNKKAQVFVLEQDALQDYEAKWVRKVKKFYRDRDRMVA